MYATKVSERVYVLDTYALGHQSSVGAYVITGPKVTLVDCGYASSYQNVLAGLAELGVMPSDVRYIVPTHVHLDHAGAAGHLAREMPNAKVVAHERSVPHLADPTKLIESATRVFGEATMGLYGLPEPVPPDRMTPMDKELHLDLGDGLAVTLIHSPGHAPHQVSIMLDGTKSLFTADAVGIVYPGMKTLIPTTPPPSFDPNQLVSTLRSLRQLGATRLLTPHFGARADVDHVFDSTEEKVTRWVRDVGDMKGRGADVDEATEAMQLRVEREAGVSELPIYAKVSIRVSVMGIMHYLSRNI
ncbi:MAG: MBL fold metallo-hydrolase [Nitrososphaerales archaeon]|jgi:glyoxylase-like metal-dependent hydrolase (beta-lactamase superfamily II)